MLKEPSVSESDVSHGEKPAIVQASYFDQTQGLVAEHDEQVAKNLLSAVSDAARQQNGTETATEAWKRVRTLVLESKKGVNRSRHGDNSDDVSVANSINYVKAQANSMSSFNSDFKQGSD